MGDENGIRVMELLNAVYAQLGLGVEVQDFPSEVYTVMADDSDHHRTRRGNFGYLNTKVLDMAGNIWAISLGEKCGSYPGEHYAGDLIGFRIVVDPKAKDKVVTQPFVPNRVWIRTDDPDSRIHAVFQGIDRNGDFFKHTILCGMRDGDLRTHPDSYFPHQDLTKFLQEEKEKFIVPQTQHAEGLIDARQRPAISPPAMYRPEFANLLAEKIEAILCSPAGTIKR